VKAEFDLLNLSTAKAVVNLSIFLAVIKSMTKKIILFAFKTLGMSILLLPLISMAATSESSPTVGGGAIQSATVNVLSQASTNLNVQVTLNTNAGSVSGLASSAASGVASSSVDSVTGTPSGSIPGTNVSASATDPLTNAMGTTIFSVNSLSIVPIISGSASLPRFTITAP